VSWQLNVSFTGEASIVFSKTWVNCKVLLISTMILPCYLVQQVFIITFRLKFKLSCQFNVSFFVNNRGLITNFIWILVRGKETCCILAAWKRSHYHYHGLWPNNSRIRIIGPQHWRLSHVGCLVGYCCHKLWQITPRMVVLGCCKKCWTLVEGRDHLPE